MVETLQANAQTYEFPKLSTKSVDGYDFINDDLKDVFVTTRGMKRIKETNSPIAEKKDYLYNYEKIFF